MSWEMILGVITHPAVITIVTVIAGLAIKGFVRYKKAFNSVVIVVREVLSARKDGSPGGSKITEAEYIKIGEKVVIVVQDIAPLIKKGE